MTTITKPEATKACFFLSPIPLFLHCVCTTPYMKSVLAVAGNPSFLTTAGGEKHSPFDPSLCSGAQRTSLAPVPVSCLPGAVRQEPRGRDGMRAERWGWKKEGQSVSVSIDGEVQISQDLVSDTAWFRSPLILQQFCILF